MGSEGQPLPNPVREGTAEAIASRNLVPSGEVFVTGNFYPTFKENRKPLTLEVIEGELPAGLEGQYMRIGPNPRFDTKGHFYHPFDGDGMIHSVDFKAGRAEYQNRWIQTKRLEAAEKRGFDIFGYGEISAAIFDNQYHLSDADGNQMGPANTNIVQHNNRLYALYESDKPYEFLRNLSTVGRCDFGSKLRHNSSAHPKVDARTKDMMLFGYSIASNPFVVGYSVFDKDLNLKTSFDIELPSPRLLHDMAITEHHSIIFDPNMCFEMDQAMQGKNPFVHHTDISAKLHIFPRFAKDQSEVKTVEIAPCGLFHIANAFEEGSKIYLYGCRSDKMTANDFDSVPNTKMTEWVVCTKTWKCLSEKTLSQHYVDFPQVDSIQSGYKTRFLYAVQFDESYAVGSFPKFNAVIKYDLETGEVTEFNSKNYLAEAVFAPAAGRDADNAQHEDQGWVVTFGQDETAGESHVLILDARSMSLVCKLKVPQRVPYGFHATFVHTPQLISKL